MKHLVQANKEKELALEKTKSDLEAKRRQVENDTIAQQDPSDPESTISSLTVSSASADAHNDTTSAPSGENATKKRGSSFRIGSHGIDDYRHEQKKTRLYGGEDDVGGRRRSGHCQSVDHTKCSVSEVTESNKGSSTQWNSSSRSSGSGDASSDGDDASRHSTCQTSGGVSSVAAVARGASNHMQGANHADVVIKVRKRKDEIDEATSMDTAFELDYEEVFLKSNVPQLLATTSGRIIAWNDFFLKATGLFASDVDRLTLFSLVRQTDLSKLFEIVAAALRSGTTKTDENSEDETPGRSNPNDEENRCTANLTTVSKWNYTAITLPCTTFRPRPITSDVGDEEDLGKPLYITVTLMTDDDPRKRCFHCVFTDCPGTNGALGSVTPELLSLLFAQQQRSADQVS